MNVPLLNIPRPKRDDTLGIDGEGIVHNQYRFCLALCLRVDAIDQREQVVLLGHHLRVALFVAIWSSRSANGVKFLGWLAAVIHMDVHRREVNGGVNGIPLPHQSPCICIGWPRAIWSVPVAWPNRGNAHVHHQDGLAHEFWSNQTELVNFTVEMDPVGWGAFGLSAYRSMSRSAASKQKQYSRKKKRTNPLKP